MTLAIVPQAAADLIFKFIAAERGGTCVFVRVCTCSRMLARVRTANKKRRPWVAAVEGERLLNHVLAHAPSII